MKKTWSSERLNSLPKVSQQAEELGLEPQVCLTLASQAHVMFWYPVRSVTVMAPVQTCSCAFCASGALGTQCVCTLGFVITRSSLPCESSHAHLPDLALVLPAPSLPPSFLPSQQSVLFLTALSPPASVSQLPAGFMSFPFWYRLRAQSSFFSLSLWPFLTALLSLCPCLTSALLTPSLCKLSRLAPPSPPRQVWYQPWCPPRGIVSSPSGLVSLDLPQVMNLFHKHLLCS